MAKKSRVEINRVQAYNFYRSIINPKTHKNYTAVEARNMRNRGAARLIKEYSIERKKANKDFEDGNIDKYKKIHRPKMIGTLKQRWNFRKRIRKEVSPKIANFMVKDNAINQNLYLNRMPKLKQFFKSRNVSWENLLKDAKHFDSLGDWLDYLGERYQDEK